MLLRKKPLKWNDYWDSITDTEDQFYQITADGDKWRLWTYANGYEECVSQHASMEAAKEAAEKHWAAVVPPGCEQVESEMWICPDCDLHVDGLVEVIGAKW